MFKLRKISRTKKRLQIDIWKTKFLKPSFPERHPLLSYFYDDDSALIKNATNPLITWRSKKIDNIDRIDNMYPENSGLKEDKECDLELNNVTQILKTYILSPEYIIPKNLYRSGLSEHFVDIEKYMWFGKKFQGHKNGYPIRQMNGIINFLKNRIKKIDYKNFDKNTFNYWIMRQRRYSNNIKVFVGSKAFLLMNRYINNIGIIYNPLFKEEYENYIVILNMDNITYRPFNNRNTRLTTQVQAADVDGRIDQFLTECSIEIKNLYSHLIINLK